MRYPNLSKEKGLWKKGYKIVIGLDEAGRGPLAGPVVAGAVVITNPEFNIKDFKGLKDSKKLSQKQREKFYKIITKHRSLEWGIGIVFEKIIDKINILEATKLAMARAVKILEIKLAKKGENGKLIQYQKSTIVGKHDRIDFLLLDGNFSLSQKILARARINIQIRQKAIVNGDEKVFSCAMASILAKVTRDRIMMKFHEKHPEYRFDLHKGYGTRLHLKMLRKYGFCKIHRKTFRQV